MEARGGRDRRLGRPRRGELKAFVRERVAAYKYPRLVEVVDELPHGPTGKIDRRAIDRDALASKL